MTTKQNNDEGFFQDNYISGVWKALDISKGWDYEELNEEQKNNIVEFLYAEFLILNRNTHPDVVEGIIFSKIEIKEAIAGDVETLMKNRNKTIFIKLLSILKPKWLISKRQKESEWKN